MTPSGGIPRSPSHESFTTDLSLMSLSSLGSEIGKAKTSLIINAKNGESSDESLKLSPQPGKFTLNEGSLGNSCGSLLQVPRDHYGVRNRTTVVGEVLFEEESKLIRDCGALSSVLGLVKSFSTSDINHTINVEEDSLRPCSSEAAVCDWGKYGLQNVGLDGTSRSLSTWVAVGDVLSTSQLPSPQPSSGPFEEVTSITASEFVWSVNKKARQMYIRQRVLSIYKTLKRLTQSELDLNKAISEHEIKINIPHVEISPELSQSIRSEVGIYGLGFRGSNKNLSLTVKDIERDKGKSLTKYERNMMIFNWLHNLDENVFELS
ncbi:uncharacterized protein LOC106467103 [Limulus polyphemus]|uniref:Uncharacterized protein LOC106467103 n=1 Tax=Limulus polyphemus TaxID=6850 RepID=A0ABM1T4X1_LIMPO|nr:uncharacterized protein LOC106467103 [Limulus polyphemus]